MAGPSPLPCDLRGRDAEQDEPKRPVALKVLDAGFPSASLLARFRFEVQVLGRLEHPGIARIYEAGMHGTDGTGGTDGTDATAQPFFAMERISGRSVLEFAHERRLDIRARLDLVARICDAVHHAHQKGVIHRDLKPSNILVDESSALPQPKILDFGIARATGADSQLLTVETMAGQLLRGGSWDSRKRCGLFPAAPAHRTPPDDRPEAVERTSACCAPHRRRAPQSRSRRAFRKLSPSNFCRSVATSRTCKLRRSLRR